MTPCHIVSWGNFGHLRALFLFWPSNSFWMGFGCPRSLNKSFYNIPNQRNRPEIKFEGASANPMETKFGASSVPLGASSVAPQNTIYSHPWMFMTP